MNNIYEDRALTGIVIDPGHGGADGGAVGNGITEKDLNLEISKYMYNRFIELGVPVALTRNQDIALDSNNRPRVVLEKFGNGKDVIVLSNHINAGGGSGSEIIYALRNNDNLSKKIASNLENAGQEVRKYYQRRLPSNSSKDYYYILRETPNTESVIVEYGFLDNLEDANRLKNNYKKYAEAVVKAVMEYKGLPYTPLVTENTYIVKSGDTLWTIAKKYNKTVTELKELNNLSSNLLTIGQVLKLNNDTSSENLGNYYIVKSGDTLYSIANKNNTTVTKIKELNNLTNNSLSIGQKLLLPAKDNSEVTSQANYYTVVSGDTLYKIAQKFNTTVNDLKSLNDLSNNILSIGQKLKISSNTNATDTSNIYIVKSGDTLYSIARNFNVSVDRLKTANNLGSNILTIGQRLIIPN